jgi:hypothetical protein
MVIKTVEKSFKKSGKKKCAALHRRTALYTQPGHLDNGTS